MSNVTKVLPLLNRVLVKRAEAPGKTGGGIVIPESKAHGVSKGTVVAVGPGTVNSQGKKIPCCLQVGDVVVLPEYGGTKVHSGEKQELLLYRESDILAKMDAQERSS